ncbi:hypothetical protein XELAEV_18014583mg [Xenopus laevis]|uniref:Uncharacterized protein n=1 Tax=Xenopus laevis TaxID=8355 RepID=A0A974DJ24_XENLA|nr:hypothetical protein XELAEV_18014583mg [Xenopus laevis]
MGGAQWILRQESKGRVYASCRPYKGVREFWNDCLIYYCGGGVAQFGWKPTNLSTLLAAAKASEVGGVLKFIVPNCAVSRDLYSINPLLFHNSVLSPLLRCLILYHISLSRSALLFARDGVMAAYSLSCGCEEGDTVTWGWLERDL